MKQILFIVVLFLLSTLNVAGQKAGQPAQIVKIPAAMLAGEGLNTIPQRDSTRTVYQKTVYNGTDIAVFMVAIGTGITNKFDGFPLEEFIYWANGKAVVEPVGEAPFSIYSGDYFIQAKGFRGKWNFVDIGGPHLELSLIAKNRPDSTFKSPINKALVLDKDLLSGVSKPADSLVYSGPELTVNLLTEQAQFFSNTSRERMLHVLNGTLTITTEDDQIQHFYPGDFLIIPADTRCQFEVSKVQQIRVLEVFKT
ncbi:MAG: cupin domain-containing protein [Bacteroidota bacterium]